MRPTTRLVFAGELAAPPGGVKRSIAKYFLQPPPEGAIRRVGKWTTTNLVAPDDGWIFAWEAQLFRTRIFGRDANCKKEKRRLLG